MLREIIYVHVESYRAGEMWLKSGLIALLESRVSVVSIAVPGVVCEKILSDSQGPRPALSS